MQRKPTKNTRGPNAEEKRFQGWVKRQCCCWCGSESGSIVDHCRGATWRNLKTLCGHWFVIPQCLYCDTKKTIYGKRCGNESRAWGDIANKYKQEKGVDIPTDVELAILDWDK